MPYLELFTRDEEIANKYPLKIPRPKGFSVIEFERISSGLMYNRLFRGGGGGLCKIKINIQVECSSAAMTYSMDGYGGEATKKQQKRAPQIRYGGGGVGGDSNDKSIRYAVMNIFSGARRLVFQR